MASTSSSWTPLSGRHKVNIGSSFNRALKARKGSAPAKRNNLPDRDFYSVRYPLKPSSIDSTKPGSLEVKRGNDGNNVVTLEHPCLQPSDVLAFPGSETPAKDWACVLIYDEETGTYTLEKVESFIALEHPERRRATAARPSPYPPSTSSNSASNSKNVTRQSSADVDIDLEEAILDSLKEQDADSDGEEDIPLAVTQKQKPLPPAPVAAAPSRPTKVLPSKPRPQTTPSSQPVKKPPSPVKAAKVPSAPSTSQPKPKKAAKRATPTFSDGEEELSFGKPSQPKRSRPSPPPPAPATAAAPPPEPPRSRLELPGTFSMPTYSLPGPSNPPITSSYTSVYSNPHGKPSTSQSLQPSSSSSPTTTIAAAPLPVAAAPEDSDEDEDWDEVVAHDESNVDDVDPDVGDDADMEDAGEEIDMDLFGTLIEEQLGEEDDHTQDQQEMDFLAQGLTAGSPEPEPLRPMGAPMSMRELAGGGDSDDDDTTSEESDDD